MTVIGKPKEEDGEKKDNSYSGLEKFSKQILGLGRKIEKGLAEKVRLEEEIREKEKKLRAMQREVFSLKDQLAEVKSDLLKLERKRTKDEEEL